MENKDAYNELSIIMTEKQKVIDQLISERNSLLKIISHDIRAPFNQIFALLKLMELEMPELAEKHGEYWNRLYQSAISGLEMVKNLNELRSLEQGNLIVNIENIDLVDLIGQSVKNFKLQTRIKGQIIHFDPKEKSVELKTDPQVLKKLLDAILSNAVKFSPASGNISILLSSSQGKVRVEINDEGPGLTQTEMAKIRIKFSKLGPMPTGGESSSGLGMYLADQYAGMLGCDLDITDREGGSGLSVALTLPA